VTATLYVTSQGDLDPVCCGSCRAPIASVLVDQCLVFVPYVTLPDADAPEDSGEELCYCLDCAIRHCCVTIEVRG
jgi:hypothetical protein